MKKSTMTQKVFFTIRICLLAMLVLSQTAGGTRTVSAQRTAITSTGPGSSSKTQTNASAFVPLRLVAPNCTYGGLIKSVIANDPYSVTFELCRPDPALVTKLAMPSFAIYPQEWIESTSGPTNRTLEGLDHPVGTGPYKVSSWDHGNNITFVKNPDYWGTAPQADMLIFRWSDQPAERLAALQAGTIDGFDGPAVEDYATIEADANLQLLYRNDLDVFYTGMTNTFTPFDDIRVRQAIAKAIDRQHIVDTFYPKGSVVATHFTPCSIPNGCVGDEWYAFDPVGAKALLTAAGYPSGFPTHIYYRDVPRLYLPSPGEIAQEIHNQLLVNLGIDAIPVEMESAVFLQEVRAGNINGLYLLGWFADYPHVTNFLDYHFGPSNLQFGNPFPAIYNKLAEGALYADPVAAAPIYADANNAIRENVPMVPVAHSSSAVAYLADVTNPQASPLMTDSFAFSNPGGRDIFRWMQIFEPNSLFCADESDNHSLRACAQVMETLYRYVNNGSAVEPALAEACTPTSDLTSYTCTLRQDVIFHDGTAFDANDVVETFAMGLDVSSPYHKGNSNNWEYYNYIFGLMDTALYRISGNAGIGNAKLDYVDAGNRSVIADSNGNYSLKVSNGWSGTVTPSKPGYVFVPASREYTNVLSNKTNKNYHIVKSATYKSSGSYDGWVLESSETSGTGGTMNATATTISVGDDVSNKQYRSILSFDTSTIPDTAVITSVTLKFKYAGEKGTNPFTTHGDLLADIRKGAFGSSSSMELSDFSAKSTLTTYKAKVLIYTDTTIDSWYAQDLQPADFQFVNKTGVSQFRLRFSMDDNNDRGADFLKIYSGNALLTADRPKLIINYYVP